MGVARTDDPWSGWYVVDWIKSPDDVRFYRVLAAAALALLLSAEYLWPWYLVWALPFVILAKDDVLTAVAWPLFTIVPIAHVSWAAGRRVLGYRAEVIVGLLG
jgi:hypothetical protein